MVPAFHNSCQFESPPAAERRRSAAPTGGKAGGGTQETGSLEYKQYKGGGGRSSPPIGSKAGGSSQETGSPGYKQYEGDTVPGGQLTLDLIATHNQYFPDSKVSLADLKPNIDPDFLCKGTEPLKMVILRVVAMSEQ